MGDRANIRIKQSTGNLYIYAHWAGADLAVAVVAGLTLSRGRWNDEGYATRILVQKTLEEMGATPAEETGSGLYVNSGGDNEHNLLEIDFAAQKVRLIEADHNDTGGKLEKSKTVLKEWAFDDYIKSEGKDAQQEM